MRRHVVLMFTAVVTMLGATLVGGVGSAQANDFDVKLRGKGYRVTSSACRDIPFTVSHNGGYLNSFSAQVEVWRGARYLGESFDYRDESSRPLQASYFWCPYEGLGTLRLGPTRVEWYSDDWTHSGSFTDRSTARISVLQASRFKKLRVKKRRALRTVSAQLHYYDVNRSRWRTAPTSTPIQLQRKTRRGWTFVKRGRIHNRGWVSISVRSARPRVYRLKSFKTQRTWNATTGRIRR